MRLGGCNECDEPRVTVQRLETVLLLDGEIAGHRKPVIDRLTKQRKRFIFAPLERRQATQTIH